MKEHKGWFWDYDTQDFYRWKDLPRETDDPKWQHYCEVEKCQVSLSIYTGCPVCKKQLPD